MARYEDKVLPAPDRGRRAPGARQPEARFAHALSSLLNAMAREGWEYLRAETLPCVERKGLAGRVTVDRHLLVFRRPAGWSAMAAATRSGPQPPRSPEHIAETAARALHPERGPDAAPAPDESTDAGPADPHEGGTGR